MSAILALCGEAAGMLDAGVQELLGRMRYRGSDLSSTARSARGLVAVARDEWEARPGFAGPTLIAERGSLRVVCDATMYFVDDLVERLGRAGVEPHSRDAADLVAAAYEAYGASCVDHLEGDFAFCVLDEASGTLFCARDPFGSRSLFHTTGDAGVAVASTPHALVDWSGREPAFDPVGVLRSLLMRYGNGTHTAWIGVQELPAGHCLHVTAEGTRTWRYWLPRGSDRWRALSGDESADTLRTLLQDVARERAIPDDTALALSGGQDSTAILASLQPAIAPELLTFRFPAGDSGDESWYVEKVADSFGSAVHRVPIADLGMYDDLEPRMRMRSHCHGHVFEGYNRALARTARSRGVRVLLNGHGGDNVMGAGYWQMADLLRSGRLFALRAFRRQVGARGWTSFVHGALRPALPMRVFDLVEPLLRRRLCTRPYERPPSEWVRGSDDLDRITASDRDDYADRVLGNYRSVSAQRRAWLLLDQAHPRGCAASFDLNRDEGVELRMPFYDRRLVEFMMSRPIDELIQPNRYKVLLHRSMEGLLPARTREAEAGGFKPGSGLGVLKSRWASDTARLIDDLSEHAWISDELGIIDARTFRERTAEPHWWSSTDVSLTLFVEAWLRCNAPG
ncbi:MAG TPA: asparagine synthase-related protein [Longimicrobiales bacterium]|nr:asparagine synthase-related protein [Longimicrobiales bacterium]